MIIDYKKWWTAWFNEFNRDGADNFLTDSTSTLWRESAQDAHVYATHVKRKDELLDEQEWIEMEFQVQEREDAWEEEWDERMLWEIIQGGYYNEKGEYVKNNEL